MTDQDRARIERILMESVGDPGRKLYPKRCYPDDAVFLVEMIWELLKEIERLTKTVSVE